jgi:hypothetical protein
MRVFVNPGIVWPKCAASKASMGMSSLAVAIEEVMSCLVAVLMMMYWPFVSMSQTTTVINGV